MRIALIGMCMLFLAACSGETPVSQGIQSQAQPTKVGSPSPENTLILELKDGKVAIELRPDLAPKHVERVKLLAREKFYDGLIWHRVIPNFMAQTGDPTGTGTGGSKHGNVPAEFSQEPFVEGTIGAARTNDPNSANSQFFICFEPKPHLNGSYTVWGRVISGMDAVHRIKKGDPRSGTVDAPDRIVKAYLLSDAKN